MSNLSDLLPAGAGGKQVDFVASGNLSNGQIVALKTDGTVEIISAVTESYGSIMASGASNTLYMSGCYNASTSRIIVIGRGGSSDAIYMLGTVSGNAITFFNYGTAVGGYSGVSTNYMAIASETNSAYVMFVTQEPENNNYGAATVGLISGSSITWGSKYVYSSVYTLWNQVSYDPDTNRFLAPYQNSSSQNGGIVVLQRTSGTSITGGSVVDFSTGGNEQPRYFMMTYDTAADKTLMCWTDMSGSKAGKASAISISGTTPTLGTVNSFVTGEVYVGDSSYDPVQNKHLLLTNIYFNATSNYGYGATILSISGSTVTATVTTTIVAGGSGQFYGATCQYTPSSGLFTVGLVNASKYLQAGSIDISTGTPVLSSLTTTSTAPTGSTTYPYLTSFLNTDIGNVAFVFKGTSNAAWTQMYVPGSSNNTSFIGITDAAISSGASGSVTIKGGISSNVSSLTPNSNYYVQTNGTLSTTTSTQLAGRALSSTSINLDYTT